ncbi:hydrolase 1, exosortase A system-associated [Pseudorhodoferax soli]|uniref:Exosortase A-associated hydrolase 1 n=1 Tax=Pseudorhodoferax soli TaxID=545864 RepID=A0A368YA24_9BURK|nr:hydrolase 1, exosortase A system-associated [Pseudorhodoferax soli]RCW76549.1 exosortase A-associated hydrolase 1 [Pseudorhodoferax soli]
MIPALPFRESALSFSCAGETLQGVLATPADAPVHGLGVLIVVGGPQVRAGSHRQFVALGRRLATQGHATLRFDVRGMGDSTGMPRSFEDLHDDIGAGIEALLATPGVDRVVLWGLCDGASACLLYVDAAPDARVAGLALLNPWVRSEQSLAQTRVKHYYRQRLFQRGFWSKLLRGGVGLRAMRDLMRNLSRQRRQPQATQRSFQQRMACGWQGFGGGMLVLLSDTDWTAREFEEQYRNDEAWAKARGRHGAVWRHITDADHTLSQAPARMAAEEATLAWLRHLV